MTSEWLSGAKKIDLSGRRGNGPFGNNGSFLGLILHVNADEHGTSDAFFEEGAPSNPNLVTPTWQVFKSAAAGGLHQFLPMDWQPWCQIDGNFRYCAVETAGQPDEPLTTYQLTEIARIVKALHDHPKLQMQYKVTNVPGNPGLGTHGMGGTAWGGHTGCPGDLRAAQRSTILKLANPPAPTPDWLSMATEQQVEDAMIKALQSTEGQAALAKACPLQHVWDGADGKPHELRTHLASIPGYRQPGAPATKAEAGKVEPHAGHEAGAGHVEGKRETR